MGSSNPSLRLAAMSRGDLLRPRGHIVFFVYGAWGHTRPLCNLAARILRLRPTYITFFTVQNVCDRVRNELPRNFEPDETHLSHLVRVVALHSDTPDPSITDSVDPQFAIYYARLVAGEPVTCMYTNVQYDPVPAPDIILVDFYACAPVRAIRKLSTKPVKVFVWYSGPPSAFIPAWGPAHMGGKADLYPEVREAVRRTKEDLNTVASKILFEPRGTLVRVPGLPPMHDYEFAPQEVPSVISMGSLFVQADDCFRESDGMILSPPDCYEAEALAAAREICAENNRTLYSFGPLVASGAQAADQEVKLSGKGAEIQAFLDSVLQSHGPQSLVYWSFGSLFWPSDPTKVWVFMDALLEKRVPFIMSHASRFAMIPDYIQEKVKNSGLGLLVPWTPQQTILSHAATAWFLTHSGFNGVMESLSKGVPMICWPLGAEQPTNAAHVSHNLNVAYELFEVRSGNGLRLVHRLGRVPVGTVEAAHQEANDVLEDAFGEDGAEKRANAQRMKEALGQAWDEDGTSTRDLRSFLQFLDCPA